MVRIMARIVAKADSAAQLRQVLHALVEPSRKEPGCRGYELFQNEEDPLEFVTIEHWVDGAAADAHMSTPHVGAAIGKAAALLAAPPRIHRFTQVA